MEKFDGEIFEQSHQYFSSQNFVPFGKLIKLLIATKLYNSSTKS